MGKVSEGKMKKLGSPLVVFVFFGVVPTLYGQAIGSFSGVVLDTSGSVISGARVTATSQATSASREAKTDDAGHYLIPLLSVGIYTVHVALQGFRAAETRDLRLHVGGAREV